MNPEEMIAVEAIESSSNPSFKSANTQAMVHNALASASSSDGLEDAKEALDASVAKMMGESDPFMQMMIAIYEVIPGTMLYKEEKLVYDTETFEFITTLNNHMTKMMNYYSKAGDYVATNNIGQDNETGLSTGGSGKDVWGLAAGQAYTDEANALQEIIVNSGLPSDIISSCEDAFRKIGLAYPDALWRGLAGPYREINSTASFHQCDHTEDNPSCGKWVDYKQDHNTWSSSKHYFRFECKYAPADTWCATYEWGCADLFGEHLWMDIHGPYNHKFFCGGHQTYAPINPGEYKKTVGSGDWAVVRAGGGASDVVQDGWSFSSERVKYNQWNVDQSTTGNLELQTTINSYSATVEAEFLFDMEQYNTYANTSSQAMKAHIDQVAAPVTRLTHLSHA